MSAPPLQLAGVLGHEASDKRIDILRRIGQLGSISEAARSAGVSYKAAWQAIETLTNLARTPLVEKMVGGAGGGGAGLTAAGWRVLQAADAVAQARQQALEKLNAEDPAVEPAIDRAALGLRTSMRNQFPCRIGTTRTAGGQTLVQLLLGEGLSLQASITRVSAQLLGLKPGLEVLAMCKATSVQLSTRPPASDEANALPGQITRASRTAGGECTLGLAHGLQLVGFAPDAPLPKVGQSATARIEPQALVIALAV